MDDSKEGGHQKNTAEESSQSDQGKEEARDSTSGGQRKHVEEADSMMGGKVDIPEFLEDISEEEVEEDMGIGGVEMKQDFKGVGDDTLRRSGKVDTALELESMVTNSKLRGSKGDTKGENIEGVTQLGENVVGHLVDDTVEEHLSDDEVGDVGAERAIDVFDSDNFEK
ncbi:hypothetical protein GUJ93_ZPchr0006g41387 [Zizania palustris]|uniref:Uncharacterized protein n=1 Tax=Zizania palustris TaxID=103762 RepID=A0A8J5W1Z7_ZIZPA|nr:hypothetical protein GUJ93_ZPchr0006g41387 [Zizania palustris]